VPISVQKDTSVSVLLDGGCGAQDEKWRRDRWSRTVLQDTGRRSRSFFCIRGVRLSDKGKLYSAAKSTKGDPDDGEEQLSVVLRP